MWEQFINWIENHLQPCIYKQYFGFECPGCGLQNSFIELLKGNLWESIKIYPPLLPLITMFIFLFIHILLNLKHGATILKYMFFVNAGGVTINYIFKLIY
ncbi:MAG: DUF2752 domain-containing protein [Bacteroidales bacterium]